LESLLGYDSRLMFPATSTSTSTSTSSLHLPFSTTSLLCKAKVVPLTDPGI
jgi:hypothetical protein